MFKKILFKIWLLTITRSKYKKYFKKEGVNLSKQCYDVDSHTCDIRCQGCSDCPMAHGNPSRRRMMISEIKSHELSKFWVEFSSDPAVKKELDKIFESYRKS